MTIQYIRAATDTQLETWLRNNCNLLHNYWNDPSAYFWEIHIWDIAKEMAARNIFSFYAVAEEMMRRDKIGIHCDLHRFACDEIARDRLAM